MQNFNSTADLLDEVNDMVSRHVQGMRKEPASRLGLDDRCGMLYVDEDNHAAISLYKSIGFTEAGRDVLYQLSID